MSCNITGIWHTRPYAQIIQQGSHTNFKHCNPFFWTKNIWDWKSTNLILNPPICWKTVRLARKSEKLPIAQEEEVVVLGLCFCASVCKSLCVRLSECLSACAVIVSLMLGVCAVPAHVRGLSNLIGDTSCLSCTPLFIIPPLSCMEGKKSANPHLSLSSPPPYLLSLTPLSLSVTNKHITMKQPRGQIATWKNSTNTLIIARYICVIFELSVVREKWIKSTK